MIIFKKADALNDFLLKQKQVSKNVGFVPTMGALHAGHLSLINASKAENEITICSIFINPTQFNNNEDFIAYPVMIEKDITLLIEAGCDILFLPSKEEIYNSEYILRLYNLGYLETILEGYYRPNHFQGVCQVVERLINIVDPDKLYLGQKDYQQCLVIKKLLTLINKESQITISICPTEREPDGLAMSSRNLRLSEDQRKIAPIIFRTLLFIKEDFDSGKYDQLKETAKQHLELKGFKVDYVEIADAVTLQPIKNATNKSVALIAATLDNVRLIDNLMLN
jgi:pantoate--beta-alanine ligase